MGQSGCRPPYRPARGGLGHERARGDGLRVAPRRAVAAGRGRAGRRAVGTHQPARHGGALCRDRGADPGRGHLARGAPARGEAGAPGDAARPGAPAGAQRADPAAFSLQHPPRHRPALAVGTQRRGGGDARPPGLALPESHRLDRAHAVAPVRGAADGARLPGHRAGAVRRPDDEPGGRRRGRAGLPGAAPDPPTPGRERGETRRRHVGHGGGARRARRRRPARGRRVRRRTGAPGRRDLRDGHRAHECARAAGHALRRPAAAGDDFGAGPRDGGAPGDPGRVRGRAWLWGGSAR